MAKTFDSRIKELQEKKSKLDKSLLEIQKQEYQQRVKEILSGPVAEGKEKEALFKAMEYQAKQNAIEDKIKEIPEDADKTIKEIDEKIARYQKDRERIKNIPLYKDTQEGLVDIFGTDIIEYAKETNNEELLNKLRTRKLSEEEYKQYFEQDYRRHDEDQKKYEELSRPEIQTTVESKPTLPEGMSEDIRELLEDSEEFACLSAEDLEKFLKNELKKNSGAIKDKHIRNKFNRSKEEYKAAFNLINYLTKKYPEFLIIKDSSKRAVVEVASKSKNEKLVEKARELKSGESQKDKEKGNKLVELNKIKKIKNVKERCEKYIELFEEVGCEFLDKQDFLQKLVDVISTKTDIQFDNGIQSILSKIIQRNQKPEKSEGKGYLSYKLNPSYDAWRIIAYPNGEIFTICPHDQYVTIINKKPPIDKRHK